MTLQRVVADLDEIDEDLTIYIASGSEWTAESRVITALEPDDHTLPQEAAALDMEYFLEVFIAQDVLRAWQKWQEVKEVSLEKKLEILLYYAENDAYPPE